MSPGNLYFSRRSNLYDPNVYSSYREKYDFWRDRNVQIINLFTVKPIVQNILKDINDIRMDAVLAELRRYLNIEPFYQLLLFPNHFSAYYTLFFATTDLNDEILTPAPVPYFLNQYAESLGLNLVHIETNISDDYDLPYREIIENKITSRTKLFYCSIPSFSGSITYPKETLERILFISQNYHLYLITDETLSHLVMDDENYITVHKIAAQRERIIRLISPLKDFSLDDVTILFFHSALLQNIERIAQDLFTVSPFQLACIDYFLRNRERIIGERKEGMLQKRKIIERFLNGREDVSAQLSSATGSVFLRLPLPNTESFAEWLLTDYDRDKKTVFVAPASHLHSDQYEDNGEVLIDFRYINSEMLEEGLEILSDALDRYLGLKKED
ncbi:aminotransferase class I/II-fold pyridoxal phosphate-dependent enzyme [candidate division WOR-3 bacterium]|nr:aminotransferase class I/II-fold pyridoxal phosphate-dependent enzyme [candidate division WOR-3 bacterium]MCK4528383.1 aminotransferase class I/II-fold pyridoxal phosphate-dependent enzyme [candidate division WOR-3 bacterium]